MKIYCKGIARIKHKTTGTIYDIESGTLDWDAVGADERQMGPEIHYQAEVEHSAMGTLTWSLWEYPAGSENYRKTDANGHEVVADFDYGLEHTPK